MGVHKFERFLKWMGQSIYTSLAADFRDFFSSSSSALGHTPHPDPIPRNVRFKIRAEICRSVRGLGLTCPCHGM